MIRKKVSSKGEQYFGHLVDCLLECDAVYIGRDLPIPRKNVQDVFTHLSKYTTSHPRRQ